MLKAVDRGSENVSGLGVDETQVDGSSGRHETRILIKSPDKFMVLQLPQSNSLATSPRTQTIHASVLS